MTATNTTSYSLSFVLDALMDCCSTDETANYAYLSGIHAGLALAGQTADSIEGDFKDLLDELIDEQLRGNDDFDVYQYEALTKLRLTHFN